MTSPPRILPLLLLAVLIGVCNQGAAASSEAGGAGADLVWTPGWREGPSMLTPRSGAAAIETGGVIHVIGGVDGKDFLRSGEYARINPDGSLTQWRPGPALNVERGFFSVARHGNHVYAVGGGRGAYGKILLDSVERAEIRPDGTLGEWSLEQSRLNTRRRCTKLAVLGNHIYVFGGFGGILLDSVERAEIRPDGTLGEWEVLLDSMNLPRYIQGVKAVGGRVYVIGGHDKERGVGIPDIEWSREDAEGWLEPWRTAEPLRTGRYGLATALHGGYLYALGGLDGAAYLDSIEKSRINADGGLSKWEPTTALPSRREGFNALAVNDRLYIIGGTNLDGYKRSVEYATFNEKGDIGYWATPAEAAAQRAELSRREARRRTLPNEAVIIRHIRTSGYSYLVVKRDDGLSAWLAAPVTDLPAGTRIRFPDGVIMRNFYSKELKHNFPAIMFVGETRAVTPKEQ